MKSMADWYSFLFRGFSMQWWRMCVWKHIVHSAVEDIYSGMRGFALIFHMLWSSNNLVFTTIYLKGTVTLYMYFSQIQVSDIHETHCKKTHNYSVCCQLRLAYTSIQSDQCCHCLHEASLEWRLSIQETLMAPTTLNRCTNWSFSSLVKELQWKD